MTRFFYPTFRRLYQLTKQLYCFYKSKLFFVIIIPAFCNEFCSAQTTANIHIAKFKADKACAISYTFDDGLKEHYTLVTPWLVKLGLKATFVVNGSKINMDNNHITDTGRMTWDDLKEMAASGQEISNHGWAHKNFGRFPLDEIKEDILKNDSAIFANIGIMPRTFAYPNNTKSTEGVKFASENRVGTRTFQQSVGGKSTSENLDKWVNKLLDEHDWGVTMTHGITYGYDHFTSQNILWEHLQRVKAMEDKIWIGTFKEVSAYVKERDSTTLQMKEIGSWHYIVTPSCPLDKTLFTETLTAVIEEKDIKKVWIHQGKRKLDVIIQADKALFDFDPFGEDIEIEFKKKK